MAAQVIDGKAFAAQIRVQVAEHVARVQEQNHIVPGIGGCVGRRGSGQPSLCTLKG